MTEPRTENETATCVMRGLLHELANIATVLDGVRAALEPEGGAPSLRPREDLDRATERLFELHAQLRSLLPDREGESALDPRAIASDVARLLAWHADRPCEVAVEEASVAPVLGVAWRLRRQLLAACDSASGGAAALRLTLRVVGDALVAEDASGRAIWSAPTLAAARGRPRAGA